MSTTIQFTPSTAGAFQFKPVIGGVQYTAIVTLNVFGGRYYLNLYDQGGDLLLSRALSSTGPALQASLTWDDTGVDGVATIETASPHNVPIGELASVYVSGTDTAFDGSWRALAISATELTYALDNPDFVQPLSGEMSVQLNLLATLGGTGYLTYDYGTQTFEWA